ncbi:hypothetical protein [Novosphingobium lentum]|uniref:hypothetical protein n=1 Tax=Novosphingobium lentum TaxID=145287 RepID=UPI0012ED16B2|nr:hypothetical protein [Novosphingobium lentum]
MAEANKEFTLDELLADPIVQLVMQRDGVTPEDVREVVNRARQAHCTNKEKPRLPSSGSDFALSA